MAEVEDQIRGCKLCDLSRTRTNAVPGEGSRSAEIMFIGEAPGFHEDRNGEPFVGAAGKFLNEMLELIDLDRSSVYITNVVKCRPPGNRDPLPDEIAACSTYIDRQIELINPKVVVTLGRFSMSRWFPKERIVYLGHANGSALECAACLDVLVFKDLLAPDQARPGKRLLAEIVSMLLAMRRTAANRVCEDRASYRTKKGNLFDHEDLDVYRVALDLIAWLDPFLEKFSCSTDLRSKLDKSTTSIVLNIAEGNGRFTGADQSKFYETAYKATILTASLLDLAGGNRLDLAAGVEEGRELLRRVAAMLTAPSKAVKYD